MYFSPWLTAVIVVVSCAKIFVWRYEGTKKYYNSSLELYSELGLRERAQNIHLKEVKQKLLPGPLQIFHFLNFLNNLSLSLNMKYTQNSQTHRQWESEKLFQAHSLNLEALINESANIHLTSSSFFSKKKRRFLSAYIWYRHKFRLSSCKVLRIHLALN